MESEYKQFVRDAKEYLSLRYDMLRLELLEKLSRIIAFLAMLAMSAGCALAALMYFSFVLAYALKDTFGSLIPGFAIMGCFFVLLIVLLVNFRKQLVLNPIIRVISHILFKEKNVEQNSAYENTTKPVDNNNNGAA